MKNQGKMMTWIQDKRKLNTLYFLTKINTIISISEMQLKQVKLLIIDIWQSGMTTQV
jgi:hypothetical protein